MVPSFIRNISQPKPFQISDNQSVVSRLSDGYPWTLYCVILNIICIMRQITHYYVAMWHKIFVILLRGRGLIFLRNSFCNNSIYVRIVCKCMVDVRSESRGVSIYNVPCNMALWKRSYNLSKISSFYIALILYIFVILDLPHFIRKFTLYLAHK